MPLNCNFPVTKDAENMQCFTVTKHKILFIKFRPRFQAKL